MNHDRCKIDPVQRTLRTLAGADFDARLYPYSLRLVEILFKDVCNVVGVACEDLICLQYSTSRYFS